MVFLGAQRTPRSRMYFTYASALGALYLVLSPWGLGHIPFVPSVSDLTFGLGGAGQQSGNTADYGIRSTSPSTEVIGGIKMTKVLNHAPGYTVIENLYWYNYSYVFLTDQPWHIPTPYTQMVNMHVDTRIPANGHEEIKLYSIRNAPVSPEVKEANQVGHTISLEEAVEMADRAEDLQSPMMINNDDNFVSHFYHWIGETFLGGWRIYSNLAWRSGATLPKFKVIAFPKQYSKAEAPAGANGGNWWEDSPGANRWFTEKFFPGVTIESRKLWQSRADSLQLYRIPLAVISDRRGGHNGPSSAWKPWGDVLRMPVSADWLVNLRERVLEDYKGPTRLQKGQLPKIMYLERQGSGRELVSEDHEALVRGIENLQKDGLADVTIEAFSSSVPFQEQVAKISVVDILVSVHGNGLTHSLWMDPGGHVFELQPAECTVTDYSPLAIAAGLQHYLVHETSFCTPEACPGRGCPGQRGINRSDIRVSAHVITDQIRKIIHAGMARA